MNEMFDLRPGNGQRSRVLPDCNCHSGSVSMTAPQPEKLKRCGEKVKEIMPASRAWADRRKVAKTISSTFGERNQGKFQFLMNDEGHGLLISICRRKTFYTTTTTILENYRLT